jgi:hypothetical protein
LPRCLQTLSLVRVIFRLTKQGRYNAFSVPLGNTFAEPFNLGVIERLVSPAVSGD